MLDIFNDDAFSVANLTDAINLLPYVPKRIGQMGLFDTKNLRTTIAFLERRGDIVSLLPTKRRGSGETTKRSARKRDMIPIEVSYVPYDDAVLASDLSGIREFNTEDQLIMASTEVNNRLTDMRQDHEITHEYHRLGAIKGVLIDADEDLTELIDLFTAFNLTQHEVYFDLEGSGEGIKAVCADVINWIEDCLGGQTYDHVHAMVGNTFFQNLVQNAEVKEIHNLQVNPQWAMVQQGFGTMGRGSNQVTFGDITFENYRGKVGTVSFVEPESAHFFPIGTQNLFVQNFAPAQTMRDVNTPGQPTYAMQEAKRWDEGVDIHTESNPLMICRRPKLLVLGHSDAAES